ncbi:DUF4453 domain-containing protein [Sedimentitalea sp. HM32M-2]|uniref:DUF4453 domain-containing protein n=1 Tax=Sedimentitalea sp. HM32M-2 TaxID=3351566 RepID=UPI003639C087
MLIRIVLFLLSLTGPAIASEACDDLWLSRNQIMDRAGYCFASPLGQALFDNTGCTAGQIRLSPADQQDIGKLRALEARIGCRVDTNRRWLNLTDLNFRLALSSIPVLDELPGACLAWTGPETPLYAGHQKPFHAIGQIVPGDKIGFDHWPVGDWTYVTAHTPHGHAFKSAGWLYWPGRIPCSEMIP